MIHDYGIVRLNILILPHIIVDYMIIITILI